jgi:sulfite exporter TauE/SafE
MIGELSLGAALLLGTAGSGHCLAMCGGIGGAFGIAGARRSTIAVPLMASLGRVGGYTLLGTLAGLFAQGLSFGLPASVGLWLMRLLAAATVVLIGLQLIGRWRVLDRLAMLGAPLWSTLRPLTRRLLPVNTPARALGFGLLWGFLPCGLLYGMLALASGFADPVQSALFMGAFGLGTVPALLGLGIAAGRGTALAAAARWRQPVGVLLVGFGLLFFVAPWVLPESGPLAQLRPLLDCHGGLGPDAE